MRKLFVFIFYSCAMAQQSQMPPGIGWMPVTPSNAASTFALSSSSNLLDLGFVLPAACTVNDLRVTVSAVTGTIGTNDMVAAIYSDSGTGTAGSSLSSTNTVTSVPSGPSEVQFTGLSQSVNQGTQYHVVLSDANGSSYPTYKYGNSFTGPFPTNGTSNLVGWNARQSTNGGSTWTNAVQASWGLRIQCSGPTYYGVPFTAETVTVSTSDRVYSAQEAGVKCTSYAGVTTNIAGLQMWVSAVGTPTGEVRYKLYTGNTLTAITTTNIPQSQMGTTVMSFPLYFSSSQALAPSTVFRVVRSETSQSDPSSKYYGGEIYTIDNDANSFALMPFGGTCEQTYTSSGATTVGGTATFTDVQTAIEPFWLIFDTTTPFSVSTAESGFVTIF